MKYFYLSVQILFTLCLMSCSSLERITERDEVIIINKVSKDFNIIARLAPKFWFNRVIKELSPKYNN